MPTPRTGLTAQEARERLAAEGLNALPSGKRRSLVSLVIGVMREPMLLLLVGAGAIYMVLGDIHDALILMAFAGLTILIQLIQEGRADRAIAALGELGAPRATVIRDSERQTVRSEEIVRGDLVVLSEGCRIPADGWLLEAEAFQADEAILTGESVPVMKRPRAAGDGADLPVPGGEGLPYAFSGTLAVHGNAMMEVAATGPRSRIGRIGASLAAIGIEAPRLVVQTRRMVRWFAIAGVSVSVLAALLYGLLRGGWLDALLAGIALAMSLLPEELPVVLTLFLTMGALRMSRVRVLARKGQAIESLGAATVLCTDKTGTLTQNRMAIAELRLPDGRSHALADTRSLVIPQAFVELVGLGILACLEEPFDPMETAFHELAGRHEGDPLNWRQEQGWTLRRQYGLTADLLAMSHVWSGDGDGHVVATKGAPEAIADLCGLADEQRASLRAAVDDMAREGLRVLGVAEADWKGGDLPAEQTHFDFRFKGLVGLADPIRESVPRAIAELRSAGVRVVMITGDYPATALAIAGQAGLESGQVLTGQEIDALDDEALAARIKAVSVFARVMPHHKLKIVQVLKAAGEIVAMTGDGVNDAPSLKAADIGIAMGKRGADVAREASLIVLLDDDFSAIPAGLRLGRRIYDNLRKAMSFIFAVHVPIGGLALAPLVAGWPLILGPVQIALLEMVIDPVCSLAFESEPEERDVMDRSPRDPQASVFPARLLVWSLVQGALALLMLLGLAAWTLDLGHEQVRSTVFAALVACVLVLVLVNRSFAAGGGLRGLRNNLALVVILTVVLTFFVLLFGVPAFSDLFGLATLEVEGLAAALVVAAALGVVLTLAKLWLGRSLVR